MRNGVGVRVAGGYRAILAPLVPAAAPSQELKADTSTKMAATDIQSSFIGEAEGRRSEIRLTACKGEEKKNPE